MALGTIPQGPSPLGPSRTWARIGARIGTCDQEPTQNPPKGLALTVKLTYILCVMSDARDSSPQNLASQTIVLTGMMGVGKTTVGRRLAPKLGLPFHDADEEIEAAAGMKISDLFQTHGEDHFRRGEAQVIERILTGPPVVLATGGGAFMNEDTRALIAEHAISIWLRAPVPTIVQRAMRRPTRPLLKNGDPEEIIARLLKERSPHYAKADFHVDTGTGSHAKTVATIVGLIEKNAKDPSLAHGTQRGHQPS